MHRQQSRPHLNRKQTNNLIKMLRAFYPPIVRGIFGRWDMVKTIDRLIIRAKKKCGADRLTVAFIYPSESEPGKWVARGAIFGTVYPAAV